MKVYLKDPVILIGGLGALVITGLITLAVINSDVTMRRSMAKEIITHNPELTYEEAYERADAFYKKAYGE